MILERFIGGRARANSYLLAPRAEGPCLLVDPGLAGAQLVRRLEGSGLCPAAVVCTHGHPDHVWTSRGLSERYEIPVLLHPQDWCWLDDCATGGRLPLLTFGGRALSTLRRIRPRRLEPLPGEGAELAGLGFRWLHTPGHTSGSACLLLDLPDGSTVCFSGDTLFRGAVGHTVYPGGSRRVLRDSVSEQLLGLPDELRVLPGHGAQTHIGRERPMMESFVGAVTGAGLREG